MVLNLFGHVARPSCNFTLRIVNHLVTTFFTALGGGQLSLRHKKIIEDFPKDLRQVRRKFKIDPSITIFATCPKCSYTHAPLHEQKPGVWSWPTKCQYPGRYKNSKPCGERLTTRRVVDGESVKAPIRSFPYQEFPAFVGGLLSRPGLEEMADRAWRMRKYGELWDIWDGAGIHELRGPDRKLFSDAPTGEARLVWSLSVDWFNPYQNKQAGKTVSTGSMVMSCLNLPPSLRHKPENLYLSIIPGPKEPATDQTNHFLRPLVDDLLPSWSNGTWYSRTCQYPNGRLVRSALGPLICDMLAARKVAGGIGVGGSVLDPFYSTLRLSDLNNIDDKVINSQPLLSELLIIL